MWGRGVGKGWENGGAPPKKVWWPPVLLIFYLIMGVCKTGYSMLMDTSFIIKAAQTNFV